MRDLFVKDEGIGDVRGRLEMRGDDMNFSFDAASTRLAVSGAGKVTLLGSTRATSRCGSPTRRSTRTRGCSRPALSPFATAVASGTLRISGTLASLDNIVARMRRRQPRPEAVRLPPAQRRPDRGLPRAGHHAHRAAEAERRGHAARRHRQRRPHPGRPRPAGRGRREPGHPAGVPERHPGRGTGRGDGRLHGHDGEAPAERQRASSSAAGCATCGCPAPSTRSTAASRSPETASGSTT